ncbi:MAG: tetratricopeptide repeat protein [Acidobacteriia bacterium]|nr:tetratricopeptide repeat protein [Terriglobia bacterium]
METISRYVMTFVVNALWQAPLAAAVAALGCWIMRRGPAWHRHALCVAALAASVVLPLSSLRAGREAGESLSLPRFESSELPAGAAAASRSTPAAPARARTLEFAPTTGEALLAAYLLFLAWRVSRLAAGIRKARRVRSEAAPPEAAPPALEAVWTRGARAFRLRNVELLASARVSGPVTSGAFPPAVILPAEMVAENSEDVLTTAIGHEMAHVARRDFAVNILYELLYAPVSFHPAAMWIHREIDRTREMACDEMVTGRLLEPRAYAQSMVSIAGAVCATAGPGCALGVFDGNILEQRIRRLMEGRTGSLKRARAAFVCALTALAACAVLASGLRISALAQSAPSGELRLAAAAFDAGDFRNAADHFRNALAEDPNNANIRLHLANAEMRETMAHPDGPFEQSALIADARQQYREVLAGDNANRQALERLAIIDVQLKQFDEARALALQRIKADPKSKNAYYLVGFMDWATVFPDIFTASREQGERVNIPQRVRDAAVRNALRERYMGTIDEGLRMMRSALEIDPAYGDAMAYCNLLLRMKSAVTEDPAEAGKLIAEADEVGKAIALQRAGGSPAPAAATGPLDVNAPPPPLPAAAPPPPPPPPPPPKR